MNLGVVGYLVTLVNLKTIGGPGSHIKDLSVQVDEVASLASQLKDNLHIPIDHFRKNSYYRDKDMGVYVSNNVRKYLFGNGNEGDEGTIITLLFKDAGDSSESSEDDNFSHVLLRKHGLDENEVHEFIDKYLDELHKGYEVRN